MNKKITPKLIDTLIYIKKHYIKHKITPTLKEIGDKYEITKGASNVRVRRLIALGYLKREKHSQYLTMPNILKANCLCCKGDESCIICKSLTSDNIVSIMSTGNYDNWTVKEFLNNLIENS